MALLYDMHLWHSAIGYDSSTQSVLNPTHYRVCLVSLCCGPFTQTCQSRSSSSQMVYPNLCKWTEHRHLLNFKLHGVHTAELVHLLSLQSYTLKVCPWALGESPRQKRCIVGGVNCWNQVFPLCNWQCSLFIEKWCRRHVRMGSATLSAPQCSGIQRFRVCHFNF